MVLAGLVPVAVQGGLSIRDAMAATVAAEETTAIEPLDVAAVQAQLAEAARGIETARLATEGEFAKLDRLAARRS